jgi:flagellar protein FlaF
MPSNPHQAVNAYNKALTELATPRQLEARLLLKAAATLQRVLDSWADKPSGLNEAVLYNRRLWIVFIDAVIRDDNKLPIALRQNILNIAAFVMAETFSLMTRPKPEHLANIIRINRRIAAGLRGRAVTQHTPQAA